MVEEMETRGRLTNGRQIDYGLGLFIGNQVGRREVSHSGATGGYRTFLARYPDQRLSLAIVCNLASANPATLARPVVDLLLGTTQQAGSPASAPGIAVPESELVALAGRYRAPATEDILRLAVRNGGLTLDGFGNTPLVALSRDRFQLPGLAELSFDPATAGKPRTRRLVRVEVDTTVYQAVPEVSLSPAQLAEFAGSYYSEELDATYQVAARDSGLVVRVGEGAEQKLVPVVPEVFRGNQFTLRFARGKNGRITGFGLFAGRVLDIRFARRGP